MDEIKLLNLNQLHDFANHPFKVLDDDKMDDLVESIKQNGVLTPVLVRPDKNNSYKPSFPETEE